MSKISSRHKVKLNVSRPLSWSRIFTADRTERWRLCLVLARANLAVRGRDGFLWVAMVVGKVFADHQGSRRSSLTAEF